MRIRNCQTLPTEAALLRHDEEDDRRLVAAFAGGDASAFERIVARHRERVARLAYRLLGWQGDVDDVVQDVFLAALKELHRFRGEASLATWLTRITINACRSHRRKQLVRRKWWRSEKHAAGNAHAELAPFEDEANVEVRRAVQSLRARDREVIVLFYLEEKSSGEIAKVLGISENAVDIRLHRARERLRPMLQALVED